MKHLLTILILVAPFWSSASASPYREDVETLLQKLDSLILQSPKFVAERDARIFQLKQRATKTRNIEERYWLNKSLYNETVVYDADSASVYVEENMQIARKLQKEEWLIEWKIKKSFLLAATGLLKEASDELTGLSGSNIPDNLKVEFYGQKQYLYSHFGQYLGTGDLNSNYYYRIEKLYKDSVMSVISPHDALYLWHKGYYHLGGSHMAEVRAELEADVEKSALNTRRDAMNAYVLSMICKEMGDVDDYLKYLIYSAMADVKLCNKDIASLEELGKRVFEYDDIDRAYSYINYCLQAAQAYHNRVRVVSVSAVQDTIHQAYQERNKKQESRLYIFLVAVILLSLVLALAIIFIYMQMKRLADSRAQLDKANEMLQRHVVELSEANKNLKTANDRLQALNEELKESDGKLRESNRVKEEYIGYVFTICSSYISKLESYRKNINRKLKANQLEEVKALTDVPNMTQTELKEFYHNFDAVFLHIYPDFVNDFNGLLNPEARITPKEGELLNTELRIYALVRLGINDSVKIAEFLHCSPQTVYNNRLKTRNKAIIPKEKFAETVRHLGKMEASL